MHCQPITFRRSVILIILSLAVMTLASMTLTSAMAQNPDSYASESKRTPVRVMSYNIRYGTADDGLNHWKHRKEFLIETIAQWDPDLLGTQETLAQQRDFLSTKLDGYEVHAAGRDDGQERGEMAAIYYRKSRFQKLDGGHFWLSPHSESVGVRGWDAALPRIASWVKLRENGAQSSKDILFINTHFDHQGSVARSESAKLLRTQIEILGKDCRVILAGDFNAGEDSEPYRNLFGDSKSMPSPLLDTFRVANPGKVEGTGTFSQFKAGKTSGDRIDWIACSRDWTIISGGIDTNSRDGRTPSDHFPVYAVLEWEESP